MILVDTNVLARTIEQGNLHQKPAIEALRTLRVDRREELVVVPQVLTEFYAVCTRSQGGSNLTPEEAMKEISIIKSRFPLYAETPDIFPMWESLVAKYKPSNRRVYDIRLVAFMLVHHISHLLTFNDQDFKRCSEIQVLNPFEVLGISRV